MDVLVGVLIVFMYTNAANAVRLEKPMSLRVLSEDLLSLENSLPLGSRMKDRVIKYDDELRLVVKQYSKAAEEKFLFIDGTVTLSELERSAESGQNFHNYREIRRIFFHNGYFYFEVPTSAVPEPNPDDYFIVDYELKASQINVERVIEYIPKFRFENELRNSLPKIMYETTLTGAIVVKTYFRMSNGVKIYAECDLETKIVVFMGNFHFITTDKMGLYKMSVNLKRMEFDLKHNSLLPYSVLGEVFAVRVTSFPTLEKVKDLPLRITRKEFLKDVLESSPSFEMSSSNVIGMIKYDRYRRFSLNYIKTNQKIVLHINGRFVTQDGDNVCCICVATPEDQLTDKSAILSDKAVLFSCSPDLTWDTRILLQEDTDYITMTPGYTIMLNSKSLSRDSKKPTRVEPYLEYFYDYQFLRTLNIVSDAMKIKCANGYHRKSFRLFLNVFLVYDCNTGIAFFDPLDLWFLSPGRQTSFGGMYPHVSYHSKTRRFVLGDESLSDFKIRQLHTIFPKKVPRDMKYMYDVNYGNTDVVLDFRSLEWDLDNIRKSIFKTPWPQAFGVVCVDDDVLIRAERFEEVVNGEKRSMVVVTGLYENCLRSDCKGEYQLVYDGRKMIARNSRGLESESMLHMYLPETSKLKIWEHVLIAHQERYVTVTSFRYDMKDMTKLLEKHCNDLRGTPKYDKKLTIYIYYRYSKEPIIGYYDCDLKYVSFFSDFKVIKYPSVGGKSSSYQPGEELKFMQGNPEERLNGGNSRELIYKPENLFDAEEEELRRKYSDYIIRGLIYDQREETFQSSSLFLAEVYALRLLQRYDKKATSRKGGFKIKHKRTNIFVYGRDAPKSAWI